MQRTHSLEKVNYLSPESNLRKTNIEPLSTKFRSNQKSHRSKRPIANISGHYCIIVKPKIYKSSSLSDLKSDNYNNNNFPKHTIFSYKESKTFIKSAGDGENLIFNKDKKFICPHMSWNYKSKIPKKKPTSCVCKRIVNCTQTAQEGLYESNMSSCAESSSSYSTEQKSIQKGAGFPFKPTPSGNLKLKSNQVVFQSSTVGVILADPSQAKVKVKIEGNEESDNETLYNQILSDGNNFSRAEYKKEELEHSIHNNSKRHLKKPSGVREDRGKDLNSLGYALPEPIDWMGIQLPKKQDLYQEFYRRVHNFINTDTIIQIGDEEYHCHRMVLQIYSSYFEANLDKTLELPKSSVSPKAFQTIYEWMISGGSDCQKVLKRDNVLDILCGAQFLSVKDLEEQCRFFIVNENLFVEDTAFALFREARLRGLTPVMDLMIPRVMKFFLPLVASTDFLELDTEEVIIFLKSSYICVSSEIEVLMAAIRWLFGDWPERSKFAVDVMRCIRFGLISPWQLVDIKRNPDNEEILQVVNEPDVQQMVDDGLAYVIIKYWYGNNPKNYHHWIDVLGLTEPAERNWLGEEKNHITYKDFLKYLEQFVVPKDQLYQLMSTLQQTKRTEDVPGGFRCVDDKMEMRRHKMDFPLPAALKGLTGDKDKHFPTMSEFFENKRKSQSGRYSPQIRTLSPKQEIATISSARKKSPTRDHHNEVKKSNLVKRDYHNEPERETSIEEFLVKANENSSESECISDQKDYKETSAFLGDKRHSVAACYLATATAALTIPSSPQSQRKTDGNNVNTKTNTFNTETSIEMCTPQISLFNQSKESVAKANMNKLSRSILGPVNKIYNAEGSLFNWDKETVLVFGGTDPHTPYAFAKNTGKEIYRFDPVTNVWDDVGELPEPRHHHSVAFLKGRVYLVGGADPRDDDVRGKSVVVSTVWSYDPVHRAWYSESGLSVPRKNFGLVVHRMALYAIGGEDKKGRVLRSVERFDPKTGAWSEVSPMSVARVGVAATRYREYIWVAGGLTGERKKPISRIVECYNSKTNEWTEIHSLRFPRCYSTLFSMNDTLYLIGGAGRITEKDKTTSSVDAIDIWDWKDRKWKQLTKMSIPRHDHALAYLGTQLIIIGGVTTIYMRALNNVESYCCERDAWIRGVAALPTPLSGHGAVTLPPASLML